VVLSLFTTCPKRKEKKRKEKKRKEKKRKKEKRKKEKNTLHIFEQDQWHPLEKVIQASQ